MRCDYVEKLDAPDVDEYYVEMDARDVIVDKSYGVELLDYCFQNFCEAFNFYKTDLDAKKYYFKVTLANKRPVISFDIANMYHLFGLSKEALEYAVIINERLKARFKSCPYEEGFGNNFAGIRMFNKLCRIFVSDGDIIKEHDCDEGNVEIAKLNWDKIAYKLYCCLNIGELTYGDTIFYVDRERLLFERKLYSESDDEENVLLIEFVPDKYSGFYNPKSIRIQKKTDTRSYVFGSDRRCYSLVKGLKKGFVTIEKKEVEQ